MAESHRTVWCRGAGGTGVLPIGRDGGEQVLEEYVGSYQFAPNVFFTITRRGDKLFAQLTGQTRLRVFASAENEFYYKVVNARLTFNRGADGKIESLSLLQNGEQIAKKVK